MRILSFALPALLVAFGALAHSGATGIVKERMDLMKDMGAAMKTIVTETQSQAPATGTIREAAHSIRNQALAAVKMFPDGSAKGPSEAAPAIWTNRTRFDDLFNELAAAAGDLESHAGRSAAWPAKVDRIAATCKACHKDFRAKK